MVCAPTVAGLYVTAQLLSPAVPVAVRPQLGALKGPLPGGRLVTPKVSRAAGGGGGGGPGAGASIKKEEGVDPPGRGPGRVAAREGVGGGDGGGRTGGVA